jgi:hypothetical protein
MAIRIPIVTDFQGDGLKKTFEEFKKLETNAEKASFALRKAFVPATAALAALGAGLVMTAKAAAEDQAAQAQLARQLQATTGATDGQIKANEDFISTLSRSAAVADDELRPALSSLVRGTGDLATAQDALKTVLDVSAATGKGVQEVADAVSKAYGGNTKAIKQLSPELFKLIKDGASVDEVMQSLSSTFGGAASTAANTAQGKFKNLTIQLGEAKEAIGTALLPVVEVMVKSFTNFAIWAQKNAGVILGIATAIGAIAAAIIGTNIALAAWKTVSVITIGINYALAASFTAVQVATGVGIAVVIAGVAAFALYKRQMNGLKDDLGGVAAQQGLTNQQMLRMSDAGKLATGAVTGLDIASTGAGGAVDKMGEKIKKAREEIEKQFAEALDAAKDKLQKAKEAYDEFKTTVSQSVTGEFSISGAADAAKEAGTTILAQLTQQAQGAKAFGSKVEQLLKMGLSERALRSVLAAGQEAGDAIATELINGGSEAITGPNGINQMLDSLNMFADALGVFGADMFYGAGVKQGEAMVAGISAAIAQAQTKLKNPNLKLADVKGIGANFQDLTNAIFLGPSESTMASIPTSAEEFAAMRGGSQYNITVNGGLNSSAEQGKAVIDAIRAANRAYGPAAISVA